MTLPYWTVNPYTALTLGNIETEYGGSAPTNFKEYYAGANTGYVTSDRVGYPFGVETPIPSAGKIAISNFYGGDSTPYTIITDKPSYIEGEVITFSITAPDPTGNILYWTIEDSTVVISITPTSFPGGNINVPYPPQQLSSSGGVGPYVYNVATGVLPLGITLSPNGYISGTPRSIGSTTFTITSTDSSADVGRREYTIGISQVNIDIQPGILPAGVAFQEYGPVTISATGGTAPYSFQLIGSLQNGLRFSNNSISGTPTVSGNKAITIQATDINGNSGTKSYILFVEQIEVIISPGSFPQGNFNAIYPPVTVSASGGTAPYSFAVTWGTLPQGLSLNPTTGIISGRPTAKGQFNLAITATDANGNQGIKQYLLPVAETSLTVDPPVLPNGLRNVAYDQTLIATGGTAPYTFSLLAGGSLPAGLTLVGDRISGIPTTLGSSTFTIKAVDVNEIVGERSYTVAINQAQINISPNSLIDGFVGTQYSQQLSASGGSAPYRFAILGSGLPSGITLSESGLISGTPSSAATTDFTVTVVDNNQNTSTKFYQLRILSNSWTITARNRGPAPIYVNEGVDITFDVTAPANVLNNVTAYLAIASPRTANVPSDVNYKVSSSFSVLNRSGNVTIKTNADFVTEGQEYFTVWVGYPSLDLNSKVVEYGLVYINDTSTEATADCGGEVILDSEDPDPVEAYEPFSFTISVIDGDPPFTFTKGLGTLPTGLVFFAANATVAGIPTVPVTNRAVVFNATDVNGKTGFCTYNFTVNAPELTIEPDSLDEGTVGVFYTQKFTASGGTPPYTFTRTSGSLAEGFSFTGDTLSGTPVNKNAATFVLTVRDRNNFTATQEYTQTFDTNPISIGPVTLPDMWIDTFYSVQLTASGGATPYKFDIEPGSRLPPGLTLTNAGLLIGIPELLRTTLISESGSTLNVVNASVILDPEFVEPNRGFYSDISSSRGNVWISNRYRRSYDDVDTVNNTIHRDYLETSGGGVADYGDLRFYNIADQYVENSSYPRNYTFTANVTDFYGVTGTVEYTVKINSLYVGNTNDYWLTHAMRVRKIFPDSTADFNYQTFLDVSGGTAPYSFNLLYGSMPGWTINQVAPSRAEIVGKTSPSAKGIYNFTIKITDSLGRIKLVESAVFVFGLKTPGWKSEINVRCYQNSTAPNNYSNPFSWGAQRTYSRVALLIKIDGTWEILMNSPQDTFNPTIVIERGTWYNIPINQNFEGRQLFIEVTAPPKFGNQPNFETKLYGTGDAGTYLGGPDRLQSPVGVYVWDAIIDHSSYDSAGYGTPLQEVQQAVIRFWWSNRRNATEEYVVRLELNSKWPSNCGTSVAPSPPPPGPAPTFVFEVPKNTINVAAGETTLDVYIRTTNLPNGTIVQFLVDNLGAGWSGVNWDPSFVIQNNLGYVQFKFLYAYLSYVQNFRFRISLTRVHPNGPEIGNVETWINVRTQP